MPRRSTPPSTDPNAFVSPKQLHALLTVPRLYFNPVFLGLDELNLKRPALFVGNHTLYGVLDAPLMAEHIYSTYGVLVRGLADKAHFKVPAWAQLISRGGVVLGTPDNCAALMQQRASIVVFPGGAREVMKRKGESYRLTWKKRTGFARMAIEHGYDIIPFGSVGPDDTYRVILDANDVMATPLWSWLASHTGLGSLSRDGDLIPPMSLGLGLMPRPQRFYFGFGPRIRTRHLQGRESDPKALWRLREKVAAAIEGQIERMQRYRATDRNRNWSRLRRWLAPTV